jgi:hypothetical protein
VESSGFKSSGETLQQYDAKRKDEHQSVIDSINSMKKSINNIFLIILVVILVGFILLKIL